MKRRKGWIIFCSPLLFIVINVLASAENATTNKSESSPAYIKVTVLQPENFQNVTTNLSEIGLSPFHPTSLIPSDTTSQNDTGHENDSLRPSITAAVLQRCSNFSDNRSKQSSDLILNIPGNLTNSDESVDFELDPIIFPIWWYCASGSQTIRTVKWEHGNGKPLVTVKSSSRGVRLKGSGKTSSHFTHEGYLHIDTHYYHPSEYCVKSVSDHQIEVETCDINCSDSICIPKCCGPDEILQYWTFQCRKLKKDEPKWFPNLYDPNHPHKAIPHEQYSNRLHYQRQHLDCDTFEKWPLSNTIGPRNRSDSEIEWKLVPNNRPIYNANHRGWVPIPEGIYCVDGYANWDFGRTESYSGDHDQHSVLLLCPTKFTAFKK